MVPANSIVLAFAAMVLWCRLLVIFDLVGQTIVHCFSEVSTLSVVLMAYH